MRILYLDIDSLRPDHLGCYGYHRNTSPNVDRIAEGGTRFTNYYVTDAPCLPSRTALWSGRAGIHTGVINHGGVAADPFIEGRDRGFQSTLGQTSWMRCLRRAGLKTVTVSPFGERHSAWHWYANFSEVHNTGRCGVERADEVSPVALDWIRRNGKSDNWFLHVNLWDPHTPYRSPAEFGNPFQDQPLPSWLTEEVWQQHWAGCGPHSAREACGFDGSRPRGWDAFPRQPYVIDSMDAARRVFDGYDTGVRYADEHVGRILNALADAGVLEETVVILSSDHGENLGEFNVYGDHQTADHITCRVPLIIRWPGLTTGGAGRVDGALHYHLDFAATTIELAGGKVPDIWDGRSFAGAFRQGKEQGRDFLVVSQGAWSCQRSVRFDDFLCIRSYHDGYHAFPDVMLFDVKHDPHEQHDLAAQRPELVARAMRMLDQWHGEMMRTATHPQDPMWTVLREGGPLHTRGELPAYLARLRKTGRGEWADKLAAAHPAEC
jgi:arylsulfatase A-like enzyme